MSSDSGLSPEPDSTTSNKQDAATAATDSKDGLKAGFFGSNKNSKLKANELYDRLSDLSNEAKSWKRALAMTPEDSLRAFKEILIKYAYEKQLPKQPSGPGLIPYRNMCLLLARRAHALHNALGLSSKKRKREPPAASKLRKDMNDFTRETRVKYKASNATLTPEQKQQAETEFSKLFPENVDFDCVESFDAKVQETNLGKSRTSSQA